MTEQRYRAVLEVQAGLSVTEVAERFGVSRLAVEVTRVVPASGNLAVCGQQFWLGPVHAGRTITLWAG